MVVNISGCIMFTQTFLALLGHYAILTQEDGKTQIELKKETSPSDSPVKDDILKMISQEPQVIKLPSNKHELWNCKKKLNDNENCAIKGSKMFP